MMQLANIYLATKDADGVEKFARCKGSEELVTVLGDPLLVSRYRAAKRTKDVLPPQLDSSGNIVLNGERLGRAETVFLRPLPVELRLRVAYDIMYEEFIKYLLRQGFPMLAFDGHRLTVFIPSTQPFNQAAMWNSFVDFTFEKNIESVRRNYYALAALHTLGMGPPKQPIFSRQHALLLIAFCRTAWADRKSKQKVHRIDRVQGIVGAQLSDWGEDAVGADAVTLKRKQLISQTANMTYGTPGDGLRGLPC